MRLIDADALLESEIERYGCVPAVCTTTINGEYLDDVLDRQPTIDAEPVRHGKWIKDGVMERCSECNMPTMQPHISGQPQFKICPYCSAKMDGE